MQAVFIGTEMRRNLRVASLDWLNSSSQLRTRCSVSSHKFQNKKHIFRVSYSFEPFFVSLWGRKFMIDCHCWALQMKHVSFSMSFKLIFFIVSRRSMKCIGLTDWSCTYLRIKIPWLPVWSSEAFSMGLFSNGAARFNCCCLVLSGKSLCHQYANPCWNIIER